MITKKHTTFNIVGPLSLAPCSAVLFFHLAHPAPATHPHPYNNLPAPQLQAHHTSASTPSSNKYRLATSEYIPPTITHFIKNHPLLTALIAIGIPCLIYLIYTYLNKSGPWHDTATTTIEKNTYNLNPNTPYANDH